MTKMFPEKIFTVKKISLMTLIFGPISGSFLIASNFNVLGERKLAMRTIILGLLISFLLFALLFSITDDVLGNFASLTIPPLYTAIIAFVSNNFQNKQIKAYIENGGQTASSLNAAGISFIGLVIAIAVIIGVGYLDEVIKYKKIEIDAGKILLYERNVPDRNSLRISRIIKDSGFLDEADQIEVYLGLKGQQYQLSFILADLSAINDTTFINEIREFEKFLNYNGNLDKPLEINFLDQLLTKKYTLPDNGEEAEPYEFLLYLNVSQISDNHKIFHDITVPQKDIDVIFESVKKLKAYFPPEEAVDIILLNYEDSYSIKFFLPKNLWPNKPRIDRVKSTVEYFQKNGIAKSMKIFLIDPNDFSESQI